MKTTYKQYKTIKELKIKFMNEFVTIPKGSIVDNKVCDGSYDEVRIWVDYPKNHPLKHDLDYRGLRVPENKTVLIKDGK